MHYWVSRSWEQPNDGVSAKKGRGELRLEVESCSAGRRTSPGMEGRALPGAFGSAECCAAGHAPWDHPLHQLTADVQFRDLVPWIALPEGSTFFLHANIQNPVMCSSGGKIVCENESLPTQKSLHRFCKLVVRVEITRLKAQGLTARGFWEMEVS